MSDLTARHLARFAAVVALALSAAVARADTFNFSYTGGGVSVVSVLTTMSTGNGQYVIQAISGTRNGVTITGLVPSGTSCTNLFNQN